VVLASKILARLLVVSGPSYVQKFVDKTGGNVVMQHRLGRWWNIPTIWPICFALLFGIDVGTIDFSRAFDLFSLLEMFAPGSKAVVTYPVILPVITSMLENGLKAVTRDQSDPDSPLVEKANGKTPANTAGPATSTHTRQRSMTFNVETSASSKPSNTRVPSAIATDDDRGYQSSRRPPCRFRVHSTNNHPIFS